MPSRIYTSTVGVFSSDVKRSASSTDKLEIVVNHMSDIVSSAKKFKVDSTSQSDVSLSQLPFSNQSTCVITHQSNYIRFKNLCKLLLKLNY
uniref:Uncharacterized protein n=1 Tax=Amphimedon queenslandica TaxID=400682 RepID=A0A1X7VPM6_AMPQE